MVTNPEISTYRFTHLAFDEGESKSQTASAANKWLWNNQTSTGKSSKISTKISSN
jgi:hypothetical protein